MRFRGCENTETIERSSVKIPRYIFNSMPWIMRQRTTVKSGKFAPFYSKFAQQRLCTILLHKIESVEIMPWLWTLKRSIKRSHITKSYKIWIGYYVVGFNSIKKYFRYINWFVIYIGKCKGRSIYFLDSPSNAVK